MGRRALKIVLTTTLIATSLVVGASNQAGDNATMAPQPFLEDMQRESAKKLERFGQILRAYAADHDEMFLDTLDRDEIKKLAPYVKPEDAKGLPMTNFLPANMKHFAPGNRGKDLPQTAVVAYDRSLLELTDGTNVLFADWRVEFVKSDRLEALGIKLRQKVKLARGTNSYSVNLPEQWKPYVSAGKLTVIGSSFYGVRSKSFAAYPHVRIRWSLRNLTSDPVELRVQYKSQRTTGGGRTGASMWYRLAPNEHRLIDDIIPMMTATSPVRLNVMAEELRHAGRKVDFPRHQLVTTDPFLPVKLPSNKFVARDEKTDHLLVKHARLYYSKGRGNVLELEVINPTDKELSLVLYAAATGDTAHSDKVGGDSPETGLFFETTKTTKPNSESVVRLPYSVPVTGQDPLLVFTLFGPAREVFAADGDLTREKITPLYWGWFNLNQATKQGLVSLPGYQPVEDRKKLTAQKQSEHFLFRYRPGSYAEQNIDTAIKEREAAYENLSSVLKMELPKTVTIDLYSDMEAKGLGSGTYYTPANTVTNTHIAEVYNQSYQCDAYHELAHIFSYNFPQTGGSVREGLIESFAQYFEPDNFQIGPAIAKVRQKLSDGNLRPLHDIILNDSNGEDEFVLIDFLLKKDLARFKRFHVSIMRAEGVEDLEMACQEIYQTGLKGLEKQWHDSLGAACKKS